MWDVNTIFHCSNILQLALKTVNTARSAFACFLFEKKFFHSYRDSTCGRGSGRGSDSEEEGGFKCKISARVSVCDGL